MRRVALLFVLPMLVGGCSLFNRGAAPAPTSGGSPPSLFFSKDVEPAGKPPAKAKLILDGFTVPVTVKTERKEDRFAINLYAHDELFDYEKYVANSEGFSLAEGAGEQYQPPIPLLAFPFHLQQPPREWTGQMFIERSAHPATAKISVEKDNVVMGTSSVEAIHVQVLITIPGKSGNAERKLSFWFSRGMGLLKRQFGTSSVREPVAE